MKHATHALLALFLASCAKPGPAPAGAPDGANGEAGAAQDVRVTIARAADQRRARDVPPASLHEHDPAIRRLAARALARIQDADDAPLLGALEDADDVVTAWAAYGLGESCKGHEDAHARALAARLASFDPARGASVPVDARIAILRALGHCGGDVAEQTLRAWLRRTDAAPFTADAAAFALGDVASRRGSVSLESSGALLDAVQRSPPVDAALYAFGRAESVGAEELGPRLLAAARAALDRPGADRFFAVRALGRAGADGAADLGRVLASSEFTPPERAEAARSLGRLHKAGQSALLGALGTILPGRGDQLTGDLPGILRSALGAVSDDRPPHADAPLWAATRLEAPPGSAPALVRRVSQVRCEAAEKLALGAWDSDVLRGCDVGDGEAGEAGRLAALDRGELTKARRGAWLDVTRSTHVRVREAAIEVVTRHPELGSAALAVLADALSSPQAGVVAVAADVVHAHPDRLYVLAASERRAALDPRAPPPTSHPLQELDAGIARAMRAALAHAWAPDLVETRMALVDASLALSLDEGRAYAQKACHDPNVTVRTRAAKALAAAGEKGATCPPPDAPEEAAEELGHEIAHATRVVLEIDGATLGIRFDPSLAPVAATRFVALARSGFYTGVVVHRVVPGFVVQLGDRGADGYGGSGVPLRCETSPVPFGPLDVGVALAGRDTGSSQIFVTLSVQPHLDGEYAWVGHADGDWNGVAEGDVIRAVRVEE
ncbi:MAG TPA: peptidylprolyl isomerase [Polyangiaceae bacterium]|jgi:cyclophilin family peptidyl-prolyl cis-trans isomerase